MAQAALAANTLFDLAGRISPQERAAVTLFGDTFPFTASTLSEEDGRFRFQKLRPGAYTVSVFMPGRGEARQTIEVGPSAADAHGRVSLDISFKESDFALSGALRRRHSVSTAQLAIPAKAQRDYEEAHKDLARHDPDAATRRLEEAVALGSPTRGTRSARSPTRLKSTLAPRSASARRSIGTRMPSNRWSTWVACW
jgi:hypothetical protein